MLHYQHLTGYKLDVLKRIPGMGATKETHPEIFLQYHLRYGVY